MLHKSGSDWSRNTSTKIYRMLTPASHFLQQNRRLENSFVEENSEDSTPVESKLGDNTIEAAEANYRDEEDEEDTIQQLKQKVSL